MKNLLVCLLVVAYMIVDVTAYTPHENGGSNISASGTRCVEGRTVALNGVPLGTKIKYDGQIYVVEDRVGYHGVMDIFMEDYNKAIEFGRKRNQRIEILE